MQDVHDVARWFLSKSPMTHKKLQKLCYYAQAWYCALHNGDPLFDDEIQAWIHGPVVASLYRCYADYRWEEIPQRSFDDSVLCEKAKDILEAVYDTYGDLTGDQLESLTHEEEPWRIARGDLKPWEPCQTPISCKSMREYYFKRYEQNQND